jgi:hypothetical protein
MEPTTVAPVAAHAKLELSWLGFAVIALSPLTSLLTGRIHLPSFCIGSSMDKPPTDWTKLQLRSSADAEHAISRSTQSDAVCFMALTVS